MAAAGTQTAALSIAGYSGGYLSTAETWNGTTWSKITNLATARDYLGGAGTQTLGLAFGGETGAGARTAVTEEWTGDILTATSKTLTTS